MVSRLFKMKLLDSSFILSLFFPEDENHYLAREIVEKTKVDFFILFEVLVETFTVINRRKGISATNAVYRELQENSRFSFVPPLNPRILEETFSFFLSQKPEQKLSYVDCLQIIYAKEIQSSIITFDQKIKDAMH